MRIERNNLYTKLLKNKVPIIDWVKEVLEKLHWKIWMWVVTSSRSDHLDIIMESTWLKKYFDFFITTDDVVNEKPDPEAYLKALQKVKYLPSQCLVIEDTERGLTAAKSAWLTCFVIPNELSKNNDFSRADKLLWNVRDLIDLIE